MQNMDINLPYVSKTDLVMILVRRLMWLQSRSNYSRKESK